MRDVIIGAVILGLNGLGAAAVLRLEHKPVRYEMMKSGFPNTVWVLDRRNGQVRYCGVYKENGPVCQAFVEQTPPSPEPTEGSGTPAATEMSDEEVFDRVE